MDAEQIAWWIEDQRKQWGCIDSHDLRELFVRKALVQVEQSSEITFEIRGDKAVFCKDGVYFALTKSQIPAMHAALIPSQESLS